MSFIDPSKARVITRSQKHVAHNMMRAPLYSISDESCMIIALALSYPALTKLSATWVILAPIVCILVHGHPLTFDALLSNVDQRVRGTDAKMLAER